MKTYIIAEVGPNHNGDINIAMDMTLKLAEIGVDAVKFQLSKPENLYSSDSFKVKYQKENDKTESPLLMSKRNQLSHENHMKLYEECIKRNVDYLCSAFDLESLIFLDNNMDLKYFKIPSGEIFSTDIINYISKRNKPVILSTGMASYPEIQIAVDLINKNFKKDITILHCISNYPVKFEEVNLNVILELQKIFNYPVGFSDHTIGNECAIASVAMGGVMLEKHVTLDKNMDGPDHKASATIEEFSELVRSIRNIEKALGSHEKIFKEDETEIKKAVRKSIVTKTKLKKGDIITEEKICYKRPGYGFLPIEKSLVIGKKINKAIEADKVIKKEDLV